MDTSDSQSIGPFPLDPPAVSSLNIAEGGVPDYPVFRETITYLHTNNIVTPEGQVIPQPQFFIERINVPILNDNIAELFQREQFTLSVRDQGGNLVAAFDIDIIDDDFVVDTPSILQFSDNPLASNSAFTDITTGSIPTYSIKESALAGANDALIAMERTGGSHGFEYQVVTGGSATDSQDYTIGSIGLGFRESRLPFSRASMNFRIFDDTIPEPDETISIKLAAGTGGEYVIGSRSTIDIVILDDDEAPEPGVLRFVESGTTISEGDSPGTVFVSAKVERVGGSDGELRAVFETVADTALKGLDYERKTGTLTFPDGDLTAQIIEIEIVSDTLNEIPAIEHFFIELRDEIVEFKTPPKSLSHSGTLSKIDFKGNPTVDSNQPHKKSKPGKDRASRVDGGLDIFTVQINDDDELAEPGTFEFAVELEGFLEGDGPGSIVVSTEIRRVGGNAGAFTLNFQTRDDTAFAGSDYIEANGTVLFADGDDQPKTIEFKILGDTLFETPLIKSFFIDLLDLSGATRVVLDTLMVDIKDDDDEPNAGTLQFAAGDISITEGNTPGTNSISAEVTRVGGDDGPLTIDFQTVDGTALAGSDYTANSGTISFADGETGSKLVIIDISSDAQFESPSSESFQLQLLDVSGADPVVTASLNVTITDDDVQPQAGTLQFLVDGQSVAEGDTPNSVNVTALVQRVGGSLGDLSIDFETVDGIAADGTDYLATSGSLNFSDGDTQLQSITVSIISDTTFESPASENFSIVLVDSTGAAPIVRDSFTVIINDDDPEPQPGSLEFVAESTTIAEGNSPGSVVVSAQVQRVGGNDGALSLDFRTIDGTALVGSDYTQTSGVVTFADGETQAQSVSITILGDEIVESPASENFVLQLVDLSGANQVVIDTFTIQISDDDIQAVAGTLQFAGGDISITEGSTPDTVSVTAQVVRVSGTDGPLSIDFQTLDGSAVAGSDYTATSGSIAFNDGESGSKPVTVQITSDSLFESPSAESFQLQLLDMSGADTAVTASINVVINDDDVQPVAGTLQFVLDGQSIAEGDSPNSFSITAQVQRLGGSNGELSIGFRTVDVSAVSGSDYAETSGTLTFADGDTAPKSIAVQILGDLIVEDPVTEVFNLELFDSTSGNAVVTDTFSVQITDDDTAAPQPTIVQFTGSSVNTSVIEGAGSVEVRLFVASGNIAGLVDITLVEGTATDPEDFLQPPQLVNISIPLGQQVPITIPIVNDTVAEGNEVFTVSVTASENNNTQIGPVGQATITVTDDDIVPPVTGNPGKVQFTADSASVDEDAGSIILQVVRTAGTDGQITVVVDTDPESANNGADYTNTNELLTWEDGESDTKSVSIPIIFDTMDEDSETFLVNLQAPTPDESVLGSPSSVTVKIVDVPNNSAPPSLANTLQFKLSEYTIREDEQFVSVTVTRDGSSSGEVTVDYATVEGTAAEDVDYLGTSGTLTWAEGDTNPQTIDIAVAFDFLGEGLEQFAVELDTASVTGNALVGTPAKTTINLNNVNRTPDLIIDQPVITSSGNIRFTEIARTVDEGIGEITILVERALNFPVNYRETAVNYRTENRSATAGSDFASVNGTLTWAEGDIAPKEITFRVFNDPFSEPLETLVVLLEDPPGRNVPINPEFDEFTLSIIDTPDAVFNPITPLVLEGQFRFTLASVTTNENSDTVSLMVERVGGSAGSVLVNYQTRAAIPSSNSPALADEDYVPVTGTLTWKDGDRTAKTVKIEILADDESEQDEVFMVELFGAAPIGDHKQLGSPFRSIVTIRDGAATATSSNGPGILRFVSASTPNVDERSGVVEIELERIGGTDGNVSVSYKTRPDSATEFDDFEPQDGTVVWLPGVGGRQSISIGLVDDVELEQEEIFYIDLVSAFPIGNKQQLEGPLRHKIILAKETDQAGKIQFTQRETDVRESDGTISVEVVRLGGSEGSVSVNYKTVEGSAIEDKDFNPIAGTIDWKAGENMPTLLSISIPSDSDVESLEMFDVVLLNARQDGNEAQLGSNRKATIRISDDVKPGLLVAAGQSKDIKALLTAADFTGNSKTTSTGTTGNCSGREAPELQPQVSDTEAAHNNVEHTSTFHSQALQDQSGCTAERRPVISPDEAIGSLNSRNLEHYARIGGSLASSAHSQLSGISSRLRKARSGQRQRLDLSGLNLHVYDQIIPGSVVNAAQDSIYGIVTGDRSTQSRMSLFISGSAGLGNVGSEVNEQTGIQDDAKLNVTDLMIGMDYHLSSSLVAGTSVGLQRNDLASTEDNGGEEFTAANLMFYGSWFGADQGFVDLILDLGINRHDSYGTASESETSSEQTDASMTAIRFGFGKNYRAAGWHFTPNGNLSAVSGTIRGRGDSLPSRFNNTPTDIQSYDIRSMKISLGAELNKTIATKRNRFTPGLRLNYAVESEAGKARIASGLPVELASGSKRTRDSLTLGLGSGFSFSRGRSGRFEYETRSGRNQSTTHQFKLDFRLDF